MVAKDRRDRIHCKTGFFVILNAVKDLNSLEILDSSLRSE
jgi:hypothetical protein